MTSLQSNVEMMCCEDEVLVLVSKIQLSDKGAY